MQAMRECLQSYFENKSEIHSQTETRPDLETCAKFQLFITLDTVTRRTLERSILALIVFAVDFVTIITAIVLKN